MSQTLSRALRAAFGIAVFSTLVWLIGPRRFLAALTQTAPLPLLLGFLVYGVMVAAKTWRWLMVLRLQGFELRFREGLRAYGVGMMLAAATPGRLGQHIKAVPLLRRGASFEEAMAGTLVDQLLDVGVNGALVPFAIGYFGASLSGSYGWGLGALALALGLILLGARFERRRFAPALKQALRLGRRSLGLPLLIALGSNALFYSSCGLVARAVGLEISVLTTTLAMVASAVVEVAPITVAGLGTREVALLAVLKPFHVEAAAVVAFTTFVRLMQVSMGALAWLVGRGPIPPPRP